MILPLTYNWRNLMVRRVSTALTLVVVAVLVLVLAVLLSFAEGINASLGASGLPDNVIVLKPGATSESTSIITPEEAARIVQTPGVALSEGGVPLVSQEICVQTSIPRRGIDGTMANVAVRGIDPVALGVHREVTFSEGRLFEPGAYEVIVGQAARERYANLELGGELHLGRLGNRKFRVVGVFTAAGGALESEIWAPRTVVADIYQRHQISSATLRLQSPDAAESAISYINGPVVQLQGKLETDYYEELSTKTREIVVLATVLISIMAIGAVFAVANTMYGAVDGRRREIAMLRAIGFPRFAVMVAFVIESLMVCMVACAVGLAASRFIDGAQQDFLSEMTWTVLAYELRVTPRIVVASLILSVFVGVIGAFAPALRAARMPILTALRKA